MKRIIERRTNVDFCKRVEVWQGYRIIDRYLTIPGWKLEGFTAVNPGRTLRSSARLGATITFDKYYTFKLTKL